MTIAGDRLAYLSGLSGVPAATHMLAIGGGVSMKAGDLLLSYSPLTSATAGEHLMADGGTPPVINDGIAQASPIVRMGHLLRR